MLKKITLLFFVLLLLPSLGNAQEREYWMNNRGEFVPVEVVEKYQMPNYNDNHKRNIFGDVLFNPDDLEDTLSYREFFDPVSNFNFGFFGQDRMIQWFETPADMRIIAAGVMCNAKDVETTQASLKLVNIAWTMDEIAAFSTATRLGWYEATGNGYNDITAYLDDPDITGDWVDVDGNAATSPFGNDLWSDDGDGFPFTPIADPNSVDYNWVQMDVLFEPEVLGGDMIGVSTKNLFPTMDGERIGWYAAQSTGLPLAFKFYQNGRSIAPPDPASDEGWWMRDFTWDYVLAVVITGDTPPDIESFTQLGTTLSTADRTVDAVVTDGNPGGGPMGVAEVVLMYSLDGGLNWTDVVMAGSEPNYTGVIPGQPAGSQITYKLNATDVEGNVSTSLTVVYNIFEVVNTNLVVFNGYDSESGYPQDYYFGEDINTGVSEFPHDIWAFGALTTELVDNYSNIFEFTTTGPKDYNDSVLTIWLNADGGRNYFLAGQEWLGTKNSFVDQDYVAGDFEYDILGLTHSYNDVSYDGTSGQELPTLVFPQAATLFGGPLFDLFAANPTDSMQYDPGFEIGGGLVNWIDAFDVVGGQEVDMMLETRGILGVPAVETLPCGTHRELTGGNKIIFLSYDPLSLNSSPDYTWYGYVNENTPYQALDWFGITVGVEQEGDLIPKEFSISQNYPNPFNPSTTIEFSVPQQSNVVIKVYDILGSEVANLVNENLAAGNYTTNFDASQFASGMYIYTITAGNFTTSKKMMLMK